MPAGVAAGGLRPGKSVILLDPLIPMRFPFSLTRSMTAYLLRKKLAGEKLFPLVLMLEPLHASNLSGEGCGRRGSTPIRSIAGCRSNDAWRR